MFEKVNPMHPDKVADRIAGAMVDLAYKKETNPKIAVEVLIGHGDCHIIAETSVHFTNKEIQTIVDRITKENLILDYKEVPQDIHLADNQKEGFRCGDNGIFKGVPLSNEQTDMTCIAKKLYSKFPRDGKYILDSENKKLVICQSNAKKEDIIAVTDKALKELGCDIDTIVINPLGSWIGGLNTDSGATNRKLGSDMADSVTGGGLHGKDLSKADVSVNIYAWLKAQETHKEVKLSCAIGDDGVDGKDYSEIVEIARHYINSLGGFEKFAEWGLC